MDFEESLRYMEGLLRFGWKLGNARFEELCRRLGDPQDRYVIVHVAGTKGKGSTTALAAGILRASGYTVGAYFSPYVYDPCERVQLNGQMIPRADFARLVTQIRPHIEALADTEFGQTTEFELKTALGFCWFAENRVDFACVEVGIGGRLDATNLVKPAVCVITNIGLDHTQQLGDTHALIAGEKAGIIKEGVPCITAVEHPDALAVITRIAQERHAPLALVRRGDAAQPTPDAAQVLWNVMTGSAAHNAFAASPSEVSKALSSRLNDVQNDTAPNANTNMGDGGVSEHTAPFSVATHQGVYPDLSLAMQGIYQRVNAACAVAALEVVLRGQGVALRPQVVREGLANTRLPGRMDIVPIPNGPLVVLDGAHNEMAAQALAGPIHALRVRQNIERVFLVVGMLTGHAPEGVLAHLAPFADTIRICQPLWKRALPVEELARAARAFFPVVHVIPSVPDAVRQAIREAGPNDMVLITGSFYTVGEAPVREWIQQSAIPPQVNEIQASSGKLIEN